MNAKPDFARPQGGINLDFIPDDTDSGRLVRSINWAATPLGDPDTWSPVLRMMVPFVLANRFPQLLWWGPDYIQIYNDAYAPILGAKHPRAMGIATRDCWTEIWDVLRPLIDTPFHGGPATWIEDFDLELLRHGFLEESHFTVGYSPVPDETVVSGIGGVLATVHEITQKVIGERRVGILRDLGARVAETRTDAEACISAINILAQHPKDVPFALLYLFDAEGRKLRLVSRTGIDAASSGPALVSLEDPNGARWPLAEALRTEEIQVATGIDDLPPVNFGAADARAGHGRRRPDQVQHREQASRRARGGHQSAHPPRRALHQLPGADGLADLHRRGERTGLGRRTPARGGARGDRPRQDRVFLQRQPRVPHAVDAHAGPAAGRCSRPWIFRPRCARSSMSRIAMRCACSSS